MTRRRSAEELAALREQREREHQERIAALTQDFSGNGSLTLGTITVEVESVLEWTNSDDPAFRQMLIYDKDFGVSVSSEAENGQTIVEPGRYRSVTVAGGDWTITIRPR